MKTPLLAVASTQNSALSWKSPYSCFDTRKPLPRSACTTPPSTSRQLALPMGSQLFRLEPSNSVVHPACPEATCESESRAEPARSSPMAMADRRFMFPPVVMCGFFQSRVGSDRPDAIGWLLSSPAERQNAADGSKPRACPGGTIQNSGEGNDFSHGLGFFF